MTALYIVVCFCIGVLVGVGVHNAQTGGNAAAPCFATATTLFCILTVSLLAKP